ADLAVGTDPAGGAHDRADALDERVAGIDVDTGIGISGVGSRLAGHARSLGARRRCLCGLNERNARSTALCDHQKIAVVQNMAGADLGELYLRHPAGSVGVVVKRTRGLVVDDAIPWMCRIDAKMEFAGGKYSEWAEMGKDRFAQEELVGLR